MASANVYQHVDLADPRSETRASKCYVQMPVPNSSILLDVCAAVLNQANATSSYASRCSVLKATLVSPVS